MIKTLFACIKILVFVLLCLITIPLQLLTLVFLSKTRFFYLTSRFFYGTACRLFGIRMRTRGDITRKQNTIFVGNHLSYIDIAVLGSVLNATFISKAEVKNWPVLGILATCAKTVFISRNRQSVEKGIEDIAQTLDSGLSLILFPEGTSTKGETVLPFKSSFFQIFLNQKLKNKIAVQPFTLSIQRVDGRDVETLDDHDLYAWYGEMTLGQHIWTLARTKATEILVTFHPARPANQYDHRKRFAEDCHRAVLGGLVNDRPKSLDFTGKAA